MLVVVVVVWSSALLRLDFLVVVVDRNRYCWTKVVVGTDVEQRVVIVIVVVVGFAVAEIVVVVVVAVQEDKPKTLVKVLNYLPLWSKVETMYASLW